MYMSIEIGGGWEVSKVWRPRGYLGYLSQKGLARQGHITGTGEIKRSWDRIFR